MTLLVYTMHCNGYFPAKKGKIKKATNDGLNINSTKSNKSWFGKTPLDKEIERAIINR